MCILIIKYILQSDRFLIIEYNILQSHSNFLTVAGWQVVVVSEKKQQTLELFTDMNVDI